jgi:two-component sensor histidine kinase
MSISIAHGIAGPSEADHRIANNLASLSGIIRFQRNSIFQERKELYGGAGLHVAR